MEKVSLKMLSIDEMEKMEGGSFSNAMAGIAFGSAVASMFFPPAAFLGWAAVGGWMSKCL